MNDNSRSRPRRLYRELTLVSVLLVLLLVVSL